jgi:hypothetical protein
MAAMSVLRNAILLIIYDLVVILNLHTRLKPCEKLERERGKSIYYGKADHFIKVSIPIYSAYTFS